jgi:phosphoribosyl-ATP pyrophosphohydrolase/phosphoribosyl-AMP cyclohydrolase
MVIASIDIQDGKVVQLKRGAEKMLERDDAEALARDFAFYGEVAVIDLDAAMGKGSNEAMMKSLLRLADCRVGGGVRTPERAKELVSWGAQKVILGSRAFEGDKVDQAFLAACSKKVGRERIIVAIDARDGRVCTKGWAHDTGIDVIEAARAAAPYAGELLYTCVEREGTMEGIDMARVRALKAALPEDVKLTAAGGVESVAAIAELAAMGIDVQLGMALYTGKVSLADAFLACAKFGPDGLIPTIARDIDGNVVSFAWSSAASLGEMLASRSARFLSRSGAALPSSGGAPAVRAVRANCQADALLVTLEPAKAYCPSGAYSCFGYEPYSIAKLGRVIQDRIANPSPGSYTATLDDERVREKILEEANEIIVARKKDEVVWEAADVVYFLSVLLAREGLSWDHVVAELDRRHKK